MCVVALSMMSFAHHGEMRANNISAGNQQKEVVTQETDIISNIQKRTGVSLPTVYNQKLKTFITTNKIMKDKGSAQFTEDYIVKQMQSDW